MDDLIEQNENPPLCIMAIFCERALHERDGIFSFIRVIDDFKVEIPAGVDPAKVLRAFKFYLAVSLKAGDALGHRPIKLTLFQPNGRIAAITEYVVTFDNPLRGFNYVNDIVFIPTEQGTLWLVVSTGETVLARTPLTVQHVEVEIGSLSAESEAEESGGEKRNG